MNPFRSLIPSNRKSALARRLLFLAVLVGGLLPSLAYAGTTYYVSTTGSDSNTGLSTATPWKTIQHAADTVTAGATVFVKGGSYTGPVNISVNSGTASAPITFAAYLGQTPVITGAGVTCCTDPSGSGSGLEGLINIYNVNYVTVSGFKVENFATNSADYTPAGIYVAGASTGIQILNNTVTKITTSAESTGSAYGIVLWNASATPLTKATISGNVVYGNKTGWSETVSLNGNVTHFTITNNIVHDNDNIGIDATGYWGVGPTGHDQSIYGEISGNTVYNNSGIHNPAYNGYAADGIYCDGCANVLIERNRVYGNDLNIEAASEVGGGVSANVTIRNNLVYDGNFAGISIGGYGDCTQSGNTAGCGKSEHVVIVNNTLYRNGTKGGTEFNVQYRADSTNIFENNIVYAGSDPWVDSLYSTSVPTVKNNLFYAATGYDASIIWKGATKSTFKKYQAASGDTTSTVANPEFDSLKTPNLDVAPNSPAIDAGDTSLACSAGYCGSGTSIYGADDFAGNARFNGKGEINLGAYER